MPTISNIAAAFTCTDGSAHRFRRIDDRTGVCDACGFRLEAHGAFRVHMLPGEGSPGAVAMGLPGAGGGETVGRGSATGGNGATLGGTESIAYGLPVR